jgi:hypothetical protein
MLWRVDLATAKGVKNHLKNCPVCRYDVRQITSYLPLAARMSAAWQRIWQSFPSVAITPSRRFVPVGAMVVVLLLVGGSGGWQLRRHYEAPQGVGVLPLGPEKGVETGQESDVPVGGQHPGALPTGPAKGPKNQVEPGKGSPSLSGLSAEDMLVWLVNPQQPNEIASSVEVVENYLHAHPEDAAMHMKLKELYTRQLAQAKDEAQRQALAQKIAIEEQRLLGLGVRNESKQP